MTERKSAQRNKRKSLIDKLGVKADSKVAVLGVEEEDFWKELRARATDISRGKLAKDLDFLFMLARSKKDLEKLLVLSGYIKSNGAVWVVFPKGRREIKEKDVIERGKEAGLVDVKVVRFSETHTALRFVIPLARR